MRRRPIRIRHVLSCLASALVASAWGAPLAAIPVEPLVIRVQDAVGAPGERTAIVFRTYASRPIRRGRLATTLVPLAPVSGGSARAGAVNPIQSCDEIVIFSVTGDATSQPCDAAPGPAMLDAVFESFSATINARDGVFGVVYVTLAPAVVPGDQYAIDIDTVLSYLHDPEDDVVDFVPRNGTLTIRAPTDPLEFSVDGGKVHPGSGAVIEIGTAEPFELQEGRLVITYDPAIATGLPEVTADPRHGDVALDVTHFPPGKIQIDFNSPLENFNGVPGDLMVMHFGTPPEVPIGTFSPIAILTGPLESALIAPGSMPLQVAWESQAVEFVIDHGIFNDGFDGGDSGFWSYIP